ncbi:MAG: RagB/SusD family nutrient uptake outer membrane protein, partial [Saprospiraceae bacterium]|nr:RagB/SusD family nutrient uptake outer membrane protein [Saprospiraceae bacterium]
NKFLDETSPNDIDAETAIVDAASAEAALSGLYASLQNGSYYGGQFPLMMEALGGNASTGGYQYLSLDQLSAKAVTPSNLLSEELWVTIYRSIANANRLLEALPNIKDLEDARKGEIEGQARTIRALAHFDLLRTYGEHWDKTSRYGIPVILKTQTIEDRPERATVAASYEAILNDLNTAAPLLSQEAAPQYVSLQTLQALRARVNLYAGNLTAANDDAQQVLQSDAYGLVDAADYHTIFDTRRSTESIFELSFDAQNRSEFNSLTYSRDDAIRSELFYLAAEGLNDFFQLRSGDVRASLLDFDPASNDVTIVPDGRTQKYRGETDKDSPAYIIRLAEMLLIAAEAQGATDGLDELNQLRTQRGLSDLTPDDVATADAWTNALLDERRAELNFEGHVYFDLARTGQYNNVTGADAFRAILPVPNREIAANDRLKQNPGY